MRCISAAERNCCAISLPSNLIDNPAVDRLTGHQRLRQLFKVSRIQSESLAEGERVRLSSKVTAYILFPPRLFSASIADDQTYVIHLPVAPSTSILLMSDSGKKTEDALLASGADLHSEILIKGQHASGESGSGPFLDAAKPRLIIATSRDFPEHERISDEWAANLQKRGIKLFRQDESGAVTVRFRRDGWEAQSYLTGETFRSSSQ